MMILAVILFFVVLIINYLNCKSLLAPSVIFSCIWSFSVLGLFVSGDTFYPIGCETLAVYLVGLISFTVGGLVINVIYAANMQIPETSSYDHVRVNKILNAVLVVITCLAPIYIVNIIKEAGTADWAFLLAQLRYEDVQKSGEASQFSLFRNLPLIASFTAAAVFNEDLDGHGGRLRTLFCILLALLFSISSGAKGGLVVLPLTLFFIASIKAGKIRWKIGVIVLLFVIMSLSFALNYINYAYIAEIEPGEMVRLLTATIQNYWLGGLVAFDYVVRDPFSVESVQNIFRNVVEILNGIQATIGLQKYTPIQSFHASFVDISPSQTTNTYTIYFSYFKDIGWIGMVLLMLSLGILLTIVYEKAKRKYPISIIFYSMFAVGLLLSFNGEHFFLGINQYLKAFFFYYFVFYGLTIRQGRVQSA